MTAPTTMDLAYFLMTSPRLSACCGMPMMHPDSDRCSDCKENTMAERDCSGCGEPIQDHRAEIVVHAAGCRELRRLAGGGR